MVTLLHMAPKVGGTTHFNSLHDSQMPKRHLVNLAILGTMAPEDISYLGGASHEKPPFLQTSIQKIKGAFYLPEVFPGNMKIDACGFGRPMTQKALDIVKIRSRL